MIYVVCGFLTLTNMFTAQYPLSTEQINYVYSRYHPNAPWFIQSLTHPLTHTSNHKLRNSEPLITEALLEKNQHAGSHAYHLGSNLQAGNQK